MKGLTPRQQQIFGYLGRGRTIPQIAASMGISEKTVSAHIDHVADKLHLTRRELRVYAIEERVRAEVQP